MHATHFHFKTLSQLHHCPRHCINCKTPSTIHALRHVANARFADIPFQSLDHQLLSLSHAASQQSDQALNEDVKSHLPSTAWEQLLDALHDQGYFPEDAMDRNLVFYQYEPVKAALLQFSRSRPDIIFTLSTDDLMAVAKLELLPRARLDRKLRMADKRLKDTYILGKGSLEGGASLQDLMRVLWDWVDAPVDQLERVAAGATALICKLLYQILEASRHPPNPEALAQAEKLGTPTLQQVKALQEKKPPSPPEASAHKSVFAAVPSRQQLIRDKAAAAAAARGGIKQGDWFCSVCGATNYRGRKTCFQCRKPASTAGNVIVTHQDIDALHSSGGRYQNAPPAIVPFNSRRSHGNAGGPSKPRGSNTWKSSKS